MSEFVTLEARGDIAVVTIDNPPVNALSQAVRAGLVGAIEEADADAALKAILLRCAGRTFIAGADITEFGRPPLAPYLPDVVNWIEDCSKPVIAALHGTALGGGLEVALGCHYRCATPSTRIGLPEVKLGLLPGAGGTQRMPRLIGVRNALDLMISGEPVPAAAAHEKGVIDRLIEGDLLDGALRFAREVVARAGPPRRASQLVLEAVPDDTFAACRDAIAKKTRGYFAPERIVQAVEAAVTLPFTEGLARERELFAQCMASPESAALRHLFFAEREAAKIPDVPATTPVRPVANVGVVGAGTMGGGIAMNFANAGIPVTLLEAGQEALNRGLRVIRKNYEGSLRKGRLTAAQLEQRMALIRGTLDYAHLADADLVIEAVFEKMALKKDVFAALDTACKPGAIIASNTSTLDLDEIAQATSRPRDVIGLHFFSPANVMRLLEIVRGQATAKDVVATAMRMAKGIRKVGVLSGVCYGFIGNRMLEGYLREANMLLLEGAAPDHIDRVIHDFGFPMGPNAMCDLAGIDVMAKIREERRAAGALPDDPRYMAIGDRLAERERFGQKTGAGIYRYELDSRVPKVDPEVTALIGSEAKRLGIAQRAIDDAEILARCLYPLVNEGALILAEGIALRPGDIDVVWVNGYGFPPFRGGPMFHADRTGLADIAGAIGRYGELLGNEHGYWTVAPLLDRLARDGQSFAEWARGSR